VTRRYANRTLDNVKYIDKSGDVRRNILSDGHVSSLCQISSLRIFGRQFFPGEGISQGKQMFDFTFTKSETKLSIL
jgi:hypothetical protein